MCCFGMALSHTLKKKCIVLAWHRADSGVFMCCIGMALRYNFQRFLCIVLALCQHSTELVWKLSCVTAVWQSRVQFLSAVSARFLRNSRRERDHSHDSPFQTQFSSVYWVHGRLCRHHRRDSSQLKDFLATHQRVVQDDCHVDDSRRSPNGRRTAQRHSKGRLAVKDAQR